MAWERRYHWIKDLSESDRKFFKFIETWGYFPYEFGYPHFYGNKLTFRNRMIAFEKVGVIKSFSFRTPEFFKIYLPVGEIQFKLTAKGEHYCYSAPPQRNLKNYDHDVQLMKSCLVLEKVLSPFFDAEIKETWTANTSIEVGTETVRGKPRRKFVQCDGVLKMTGKKTGQQGLYAIEFERTQKAHDVWRERFKRYLKAFHQKKLEAAFWVVSEGRCWKQIDDALNTFDASVAGYEIEIVPCTEANEWIKIKSRALAGMFFFCVDYKQIEEVWNGQRPHDQLQFVHALTQVHPDYPKRHILTLNSSPLGNASPFQSSLKDYMQRFDSLFNHERKTPWKQPTWW